MYYSVLLEYSTIGMTIKYMSCLRVSRVQQIDNTLGRYTMFS